MIENELRKLLYEYVREFNEDDEELYPGDITNAGAFDYLSREIPLIECPDKTIEKVYYYRFWTLRKHWVSTPFGHILTEFAPPVSWAGPFNSINAAVGHHLREARWLRDRDGFIKEYISFWLDRRGNTVSYSSWLASAVEDYLRLHPDREFESGCIDRLVSIYDERTEKNLHSCGLYWSDDGWDAMECSISGSGIRPTMNSYMAAGAASISRMAARAGRFGLSETFAGRSRDIREKMDALLWDGDFYKVIPCGKDSVLPDGVRPPVEPEHDVREQIGFIPWYFDLPGADKSVAFRYLTDPRGFAAPFGITTAQISHPRFFFDYPHDCLWNGYVWPFATSQTLTAAAKELHRHPGACLTKEDYFGLLRQYAASHRLDRGDGKEHLWIDESMDPFTGDWSTRTKKIKRNWGSGYRERGKDYNHSTFCDLVLSGLFGIEAEDGKLTVSPLIPDDWDWFAAANLPPRGETVIFDRTGKRYGLGAGLHVLSPEN